MTRPNLHEIPLSEALDFTKPQLVITMSPDQWDDILKISYEQGWILIEVDGEEQPVRAYRRQAS